MTANIITPQNVQQIFGSPYIPDNQVLYVKTNTAGDESSTCLKIIVRDMRSHPISLMIAGEVLSDTSSKGSIICCEYPRDTFMLKYFSKYFWVFVAVAKFKILLRRVRIKKDKKNAKTFLMWTKTTEGEFGGGSNFPVRKAIVDYVATY